MTQGDRQKRTEQEEYEGTPMKGHFPKLEKRKSPMKPTKSRNDTIRDATDSFRREVPNGTAARGEEAQAATRIFWPEQPGKEKERHGAAGPPSAARERKASVARIARSGAARVERSEERAGGQKKRES